MLSERQLKMLDDIKTVCAATEESEIETACREFAKDTEMAVNSFGVNAKEIVEAVRENKAYEEFFETLSYIWVRFLAYAAGKDFRYDGRNEYSVKKGSELFNDPDFQENAASRFSFTDKDLERCINEGHYRYLPEMLKSKELYIASRLYRTHKTLFQTFSKIVFCFLDQTDRAVKKLVADGTFTETWWRCPLI